MTHKNVAAIAFLVSSFVVAACGGGSSTMNNAGDTSGGGTVSGTVVKGAVNGAVVTAYAVGDGTMGAQVGSGTTDASGNFTFSVGSYSGPMMLQAAGGTYTDEATGTAMTMQPGDVMAAGIPSVTAGATTGGFRITPLTSMAHARAHHMSGGITAANITAANSAIGTLYGVGDILHTMPMDPLVQGSATGASQDSRTYGMVMAAMSQYAKSLGMTSSSAMVTAFMNDASDGVMDGNMGTTPVTLAGGVPVGTTMQANAATAGLVSAMATFIGSAMNRSGLSTSDMQSMMSQLSGSSGQMPGAGGGMTNGMMTGTGTKGPVAGATVTAYAIVNGMMGAQLGSAPTDGSGHFGVPMGSYGGTVMLRMNGGTFMDEATETSMPMMSSDVMLACVPSVAAGSTTSSVQVTPLTSMACARAKAMTGGMTDKNVNAANTAVGSYFSVNDVLHTMPMNPLVTGSGASASQDSRNYGMTIATMSQYAKTVGMTTSSSGMVTAMMDDASDGVMNGMMGSAAIDMNGMGGMTGGGMMGGGGMMQPNAGTSGLASAMTAFVGSTRNRSGVSMSDMQALINELTASNGTMQ